jgi:hypothetical protein
MPFTWIACQRSVRHSKLPRQPVSQILVDGDTLRLPVADLADHHREAGVRLPSSPYGVVHYGYPFREVAE